MNLLMPVVFKHIPVTWLQTTHSSKGRVAHRFIFCVVLLCVFTFFVPCCDVRSDFRI